MTLKMKSLVLLAGLAAMLPVAAQAQNVVQSNAINIAAVVTIGGPPASVTQTGRYNYAGVVQAGVNPTAAINQNGTVLNSGFIGQSGRNTSASINQSGGPRVYNSAAVSQSAGWASTRRYRR